MDNITITNIPYISAIYYALLQCGYDYYTYERDEAHIKVLEEFCHDMAKPSGFFSGVKQNTCETYPYWPRASLLESASFYINDDISGFSSFSAFKNKVMNAGNITDEERDKRFWDWIEGFPEAIKNVMSDEGFKAYIQWENGWITSQNTTHADDLLSLKNFLNYCVNAYGSSNRHIKIALSPIKCVYSSDYHLINDCFIFSSGDFKSESVIHEFLHHIVHPLVLRGKDAILTNKIKLEGIDDSYYLSGGETGGVNAFEEYFVRSLTQTFLDENPPTDLKDYMANLLSL